jgi:hypothetical protein
VSVRVSKIIGAPEDRLSVWRSGRFPDYTAVLCVGYPKLSINEQRAAGDELTQIVPSNHQRCSKLKHGGSKSEPVQSQSEVGRSLWFRPLGIDFG